MSSAGNSRVIVGKELGALGDDISEPKNIPKKPLRFATKYDALDEVEADNAPRQRKRRGGVSGPSNIGSGTSPPPPASTCDLEEGVFLDEMLKWRPQVICMTGLLPGTLIQTHRPGVMAFPVWTYHDEKQD